METVSVMRDAILLEDDACSQSRLKSASTSGDSSSTLTAGSASQTIDDQLDWVRVWEQQNPGYQNVVHVNRRTHDDEKRVQSPSKRESSRADSETVSPFTRYAM